MHANVVGGPQPETAVEPVQVGSLGNNNPLRDPLPNSADNDKNDETLTAEPNEEVQEDHSNNVFNHSTTDPSTLLPASDNKENDNDVPTNTGTSTTTMTIIIDSKISIIRVNYSQR